MNNLSSLVLQLLDDSRDDEIIDNDNDNATTIINDSELEIRDLCVGSFGLLVNSLAIGVVLKTNQVKGELKPLLINLVMSDMAFLLSVFIQGTGVPSARTSEGKGCLAVVYFAVWGMASSMVTCAILSCVNCFAVYRPYKYRKMVSWKNVGIGVMISIVVSVGLTYLMFGHRIPPGLTCRIIIVTTETGYVGILSFLLCICAAVFSLNAAIIIDLRTKSRHGKRPNRITSSQGQGRSVVVVSQATLSTGGGRVRNEYGVVSVDDEGGGCRHSTPPPPASNNDVIDIIAPGDNDQIISASKLDVNNKRYSREIDEQTLPTTSSSLSINTATNLPDGQSSTSGAGSDGSGTDEDEKISLSPSRSNTEQQVGRPSPSRTNNENGIDTHETICSPPAKAYEEQPVGLPTIRHTSTGSEVDTQETISSPPTETFKDQRIDEPSTPDTNTESEVDTHETISSPPTKAFEDKWIDEPSTPHTSTGSEVDIQETISSPPSESFKDQRIDEPSTPHTNTESEVDTQETNSSLQSKTFKEQRVDQTSTPHTSTESEVDKQETISSPPTATYKEQQIDQPSTPHTSTEGEVDKQETISSPPTATYKEQQIDQPSTPHTSTESEVDTQEMISSPPAETFKEQQIDQPSIPHTDTESEVNTQETISSPPAETFKEQQIGQPTIPHTSTESEVDTQEMISSSPREINKERQIDQSSTSDPNIESGTDVHEIMSSLDSPQPRTDRPTEDISVSVSPTPDDNSEHVLNGGERDSRNHKNNNTRNNNNNNNCLNKPMKRSARDDRIIRTLVIMTSYTCVLLLPTPLFILVIISSGIMDTPEQILNSYPGIFSSTCLGIKILINPFLYALKFIPWRNLCSFCKKRSRVNES